MNNKFVFFCKTYLGDIKRFKLFYESFNKYNIENILMYVSVPEKEFKSFVKYNSNNVIVISDESYAGKYFTKEKYHKFQLGYINQEICKLAFWENNFCSNYLCLDSDLLFIRNFRVSDFMNKDNIPYTVLIMDKDLAVEKSYQKFWDVRQNFIDKIYKEMDLNDPRLRTCHGMQVLNCEVLRSLKEDFMVSKNFSYKDLIRIAPFEFTWYNVWFQKCKLVPEYAVEPFFKVFHSRCEYILSLLKGLSVEDYSRSYIGIILNSNWKRQVLTYGKRPWFLRILYKILKRL